MRAFSTPAKRPLRRFFAPTRQGTPARVILEQHLNEEGGKMIPVFKPSYDKEELAALQEVFASGWLGLGPVTRKFEEEFAGYIGVKYAAGMNSGTAALHLALKLMEVEGGEVITTPLTFVSTSHAILYNQATPVFADVEEDTLNISPAEIARLITPRTKAILVVHYGGHPCEMQSILELARSHRLKVVEDCAHAAGSRYRGQRVGSLADAGCFSFHAVKNLACGEGGMITLDDEKGRERLNRLRWLGIDKGTWERSAGGKHYHWQYQVRELGYKYHLHDIPAALGLVQLKKLERLNERRRQIVSLYNQAFAGLNWLQLPVEKDYAYSACHNYVVKLDQRDKFIDYMAEKGIATGVHYFPVHRYPLYRPFCRSLPVAERVAQKIVTLPLFPDLSPEQIEYVIDQVRSFGRLYC